MRMFLSVMFIVPFMLWSGMRIYKGITYTIECGGHIKRAADASTVPLAQKELGTALSFLERQSMTEGYTSIAYQTPNEDVGFWYSNMRAAREELDKVTDATTQLERSNLLIKLRETLLDEGDKGTKTTEPTGISIFPHNVEWAVFGFSSALMALVGVLQIVMYFRGKEKKSPKRKRKS